MSETGEPPPAAGQRRGLGWPPPVVALRAKPHHAGDTEWAVSASVAFGLFALAIVVPVMLLTKLGNQVFSSTWPRLALSCLIALLFALAGRAAARGQPSTLGMHVRIIGGENPLMRGGYVAPGPVAGVYMARRLNRYLPLVGFIPGYLLGAFTAFVWAVLYSPRPPFSKKQVVGVEIFAAATQFAADWAEQGKKFTVLSDEDALDKLVARADNDLALHGELVAFFRAHYDTEKQGTFQIHERHLTDSEWVSFLNEKFSERKWQNSRYQGTAGEYIIVVLFS